MFYRASARASMYRVILTWHFSPSRRGIGSKDLNWI